MGFIMGSIQNVSQYNGHKIERNVYPLNDRDIQLSTGYSQLYKYPTEKRILGYPIGNTMRTQWAI